MDLTTGVIGSVKASDGSGTANATIYIYGDKGGGKATTDASGNFFLLGLASGTYTAKVIAPNFKVLEQGNIQIYAGALTTVNFSLSSQMSIPYELQPAIYSSFDKFASLDYANLIILTATTSPQDCEVLKTVCNWSCRGACLMPCTFIPAPVARAVCALGCIITCEIVCRKHIDDLKKCGGCK